MDETDRYGCLEGRNLNSHFLAQALQWQAACITAHGAELP
jgi:hypothetical protein